MTSPKKKTKPAFNLKMSYLDQAIRSMPREANINNNIEKIVYLDQDFTTFEYFLTGKYNRPEKIDLEAYLQAEMKAKMQIERDGLVSEDIQNFLSSYEKPLMQCE